jgi:hypothetical protein
MADRIGGECLRRIEKGRVGEWMLHHVLRLLFEWCKDHNDRS